MARIEIAPGCTGMQESVKQIDELIAREKAKFLESKVVKDAMSLYESELANQAWVRRLADLCTARQILLTHLDAVLQERWNAEASESLEGKGKLKKVGWKCVSLTLLGGNTLRLETPYLRVKGKQAKKSRGKQGRGIFPVLRGLGIEERLSPAVRLEVGRQVVLNDSYAEAQNELQRRGLSLSKEQVTQVAVSTGSQALELRKEGLSKAREASLPTFSSFKGKTVRIAMDGGRARTRESRPDLAVGENNRRPFELAWREPRVITIDVLGRQGKANGRFAPIYETTLDGAKKTFELLTSTLRLLGVHLAKKVLFIADGAKWIHARAIDALFAAGVEPEKIYLALDYYHATEKIYEILSVCTEFNESSRLTYFKRLKTLLKKPDGAQKVIDELQLLARGRRARTLKKKLAYLKDRLHLMDYALLIKKHLSIGSGVVESAVRRVINLRFKSASMCWKPQHLSPLLYLRAILKSGRWDQFVPPFLSSNHYLHHNLPLATKTATSTTICL